jgi:carbon-monoxide dehydrogenase medium subunit
MYAFTFHRPQTVRQAAGLLTKNGDAKLLAGGQTLLPTMKLRLAGPPQIIDMTLIEGMSGIEQSGRTLTIGAMTTHNAVNTSPVVQQAAPVLAHLAGLIGDPAVRHRGTIGGSIANNDPNADYPAACLGLGATIVTNKRRVKADDFFTGMFSTVLEPAEIITKVIFPLPKKAAYQKFRNQASRFALVGVFVSKRGRHGRRLEWRVPGEIVRGGAQEAVLAEIARRPDHPGRRHELRHPWQRRVSRASGQRIGAPRCRRRK